jgi:NAD(P)-dependent dehydrogenase (short-subunit alcohol dehydrogenase family)
MENFSGKMAVITGGGTGMGRSLCQALVNAGCHIALCDVVEENMAETKALCEAGNSAVRVSTHICDVSVEADMLRFQTEVAAVHGETIDLLFNNAGIGGGGGFVSGDREEWEKTFSVCWHGVYYGCRAFLPMLLASEEGHIINTSSVNGFWASLGPTVPHTAYAAAKFAVKGFSEALITDLRLNAPHIAVSVVMPGHIGTSIAINSGKILGHTPPLEMSETEIKEVRERLMSQPGPMSEAIMNVSDDQLRTLMHHRGIEFRDNAPMTADQAADVILAGVKAKQWRILVGEDAERLDERVRQNPWNVYELDFSALTSINAG